MTTKVEDFVAYSKGLCHTSVCTSLSDEQATQRLNHLCPTGIDSAWQISDESFADGTPNPTPCPDTPGHRHILFHC